MADVKLIARKYTGEGAYHGFDSFNANKRIDVVPGAAVLMSQEKADELEEKYPDQWDDASAAEAKKAEAAVVEANAPVKSEDAEEAKPEAKSKGKGKRK